MPGTVSAIILITREIQAPLIGLVMLGACASKLARMRAGPVSAGLGPTELFPRRLRAPAAAALCAVELCLGLALLGTIGREDVWADGSRLAAVLFFLVATCALVEMRGRRPDVACGCFGDFSSRPAGARSVARAAILSGAAVAGLGIPPFRLPAPGRGALPYLAVCAGELLLVAALSPEVGHVLERLGYSEPCEVRTIAPQRVIALLHRSSAWRAHADVITSDTADDMWRELCWWYVVYPARDHGVDCHVVFAVQVKPRRPLIHAAVAGPTAAGDPAPAAPATAQERSALGSGAF